MIERLEGLTPRSRQCFEYILMLTSDMTDE